MSLHIKGFFFLLAFITAVNGFSQNVTTTFYDYKWQPCDVSKARFYGTTEKTDSGWLRNDFFLSTQQIQMSALYIDNTCKIKNGYATFFHANGNLDSRGRYVNGKKEGVHISYHFNGMMADSGNYHNDEIVGSKLSWHPNGFMADSIYQKDDSTKIKVSWFDNGSISEYGYFINKKKHGKWNYFHSNGNIACTESDNHGKIISVQYFDETGKELTDTTNVNREAIFKKGIADWHNYLSDKTYWPAEYKITNSDIAVVVVAFTINEEGKVTDVHVTTPFHRLMDNIATDAIIKSPVWQPRLDHNRKVKQSLRQPVTFKQDTE